MHFSDRLLYFSRLITIQLIARGYILSNLRKISNMVANLDRSELLKYKIHDIDDKFTKSIFFQTKFSMNLTNVKEILHSSWNRTKKSISSLENFKLFVIHNMQPNISSLLVHNFKLPLVRNFCYNKCNSPFCVVCKFASIENHIFINNFFIPILCNSNCDSSNIIYILKCKVCNLFYIGQSSSTVKK